MAEVIQMPRMSDTMEEGIIVAWHKKVGDSIEPGDLLAEVETDKATMELESYQEGVILYIGVEKGAAVPVEGVLAIIGEEGEDYKTLLDELEAKSEAKASEAKKEGDSSETSEEENKELASATVEAKNDSPKPSAAKAEAKPKAESVATANANGRVKISPLAKKLATEHNIDFGTLSGSGEEGRIVKRDIESYLANPQPAKVHAEVPANITLPTIVAEEQFEDIALSSMRKTIARRLGESKFQAPHFYLTIDVTMDNVMATRKTMNEISPVKISFNDIVIKAAAMALRKHPYVNSSWLGDKIRLNKHIHIGMAVAVDEGLLVPVIPFADNKSLAHIASETKTLGGKAKNKQLSMEEMQGNTFSISNLGMMGIEEFTAIINPPDACIMAVGTIRQVPMQNDSGNWVTTNKMKVTLSCDHRLVDGATGALFLQSFKANLENPTNMLV